MARQIFAAEISHEDTPIPIREKLTGDERTIKQHLVTLNASVDEAFILSTCNRFTVYVIAREIAPLKDFFAQFPAIQGYLQFYYNTEESVTHLFAVASGLLSPIKGDSYIIDQIGQAHQWALETGSIGISLDNLLNHALRVGKRARTESGIDKFCCSVIHVGIDLLFHRLDGPHDKKFLVIGTGKVARAALKCLADEGIRNICIVSKDSGRAAELAELYSTRAADISEIDGEVMAADVIIGATHYEVQVFANDFLARKISSQKVWFVLDFGMPRNFNHQLSENSCIELYNLDDLKRLYKSPLDDFGGIEGAWRIVMNEARDLMEILLQLELSPILVAYWNRLIDVRDRKTNLHLPDLERQLSPTDIESIKTQAHRLLRHLSPDPWKDSKILGNNLRADNGLEAVRNLAFEKIRLNVSVN